MSDPLRNGFELLWYEVESVIGKGGFGITYRARDKNLSRRVAIKEHFPGSFAERREDYSVIARDGMDGNYDWSLQNFIAESRTLARFRHPNIVRVMSVFESLGTAYMVMEFEAGSSLRRAVSDDSFNSEGTLLMLIRALLDGLERVHDAGFIHRDIKPANIQIRESGEPVLLDFGSARHDIAARQGDLTGLVSPHYAPFEQFKPDEADSMGQGPWSDIYALGATLFEVVTRRRPPETLARASALLHGRDDPLPILRDTAPEMYSRQTLDAIAAGLAFASTDRPRSIADWRAQFPFDGLGNSVDRAPAAATFARTETEDPATRVNTDAASGQSAGSVTIVDTEKLPAAPVLVDRSILVVDDEAFILNLAVRVLQSLGANKIQSAASAQEALDSMRAGAAPDLILLDLNLPDMDGIQVLGELGNLGYAGELVLVSGEETRVLRTAETIATGYELKILGTIEKPMTREKLTRVLGEQSNRRLPSAPASAQDFSSEEIDAAFAGDQLITYYQPKLKTSNRALAGLEALVRWVHPERGLLTAGAFVPAIDAAGMGSKLTDRVMGLALGDTGSWLQEGLHTRISVNMQLDYLLQPNYPETLVQLAANEGVQPGQVTLEITESSVDTKLMRQLEALTRLRLRGVGLAVDDFGSGRVALVNLKTLPFTELKIDRDLVVSATRDHDARALVESAVDLGRRLDLVVVAEGVETEEEWSIISELGCEEVQGTYLAGPMPPGDVLEWARKWER